MNILPSFLSPFSLAVTSTCDEKHRNNINRGLFLLNSCLALLLGLSLPPPASVTTLTQVESRDSKEEVELDEEEEPEMSAAELSALVTRLEAVAVKLEGVSGGGKQAAAGKNRAELLLIFRLLAFIESHGTNSVNILFLSRPSSKGIVDFLLRSVV